MTATTDNFERMSYWYTWEGEDKEGMLEILKLEVGSADRVAQQVAKAIAKELTSSVVLLNGSRISNSLPLRLYSELTRIDIDVQSEFHGPFQLSIYDAGLPVPLAVDNYAGS